MLLTPTRRVGVNIGQKSAIATNSSSDWRNYSVGVNNGHKKRYWHQLNSVHAVCNTLLEWNSTHYFLAIFNPRPEGYGSRFVVLSIYLSVNSATEGSAYFFAPVKVRTG